MREVIDNTPDSTSDLHPLDLFCACLGSNQSTMLATVVKRTRFNSKYLLVRSSGGNIVYRLEKNNSLGTGSTGRVKTATRLGLFDGYCIKKEGSNTSWIVKRPIKDKCIREALKPFFRQEAMTATVLGLPAQFIQYTGKSEKEKFLILMERVPGEELMSWIPGIAREFKEFPLKVILAIVLKSLGLLEKLEAIHKAGYLHRDIKPENILVETSKDESGETYDVNLVDFGLSKKRDEPFLKIHGTQGYIAPESKIARGIKDDQSTVRYSYTEKSDIYAVAVTMASLLLFCLDVAQYTCFFDAEKSGEYFRFDWLQYKGSSDKQVEKFVGDFRGVFAKAGHDVPEERPTLSDLRNELKRLEGQLVEKMEPHKIPSPSNTP